MAIPNDITGKKVKAQPYDENGKPLSGLVLPILDGGGNIIGWAPVATTDNGDGTVSLKVDTELIVETATFNVTNIKVGSTDQTAGNTRYLKTDTDGVVQVAVVSGGGADANIAKWGGVDQTGADLTPLFQHLDVDLSTRASEATLTSVKTNLDSILAQLDVALSTRASESTLSDIKDELDTVETKLQSIIDNTDSLEANTDDVEAKLEDIKSKLDSLIAKDFATETTLVSVLSSVDGVESKLDTLNGKDFATETTLLTRATESTLSSAKTVLDNILAQLDVALSTRASESTLSDIKDELDTVETKLQAIIDNTDSLEINTDELESKVQSVRDQLDVLLSTRASEATLALIKAKTDNLDSTLSSRATEATLALIKAKTDNINVLLSTIASEATLALIKAKTDNLDVALSTRASESTLSGIKGDLDNVVSTANSTSTPLGSGGTFTGTVEEVTKYGSIAVFVYSDVASATDGCIVEYSTDGVNFDDSDTYTVPANNGKFFTFGPEARYFRVRYINGTSAQTTFRLQTILRARPMKYSSHRADDLIEENSDTELVRAVTSEIGLTLANENKIFFGPTEANLATGGSENRAILLRNPAGSGKTLFVGLCVLDMLTKGGQATIRIYKDPTVTSAGTSVTPVSSKIDGSVASSATLYTLPTISANGTRMATFSVGKDASSFPIDFKFSLILAAGHDILITGNPDANNRLMAFTFQWAEV